MQRQIETPIDSCLDKARAALESIKDSARADTRRLAFLEEVLQQKAAIVQTPPLASAAIGECFYELRQETQVTGDYFVLIHWIHEGEPDFVELMDLETFGGQWARMVGSESHRRQLALTESVYRQFKAQVEKLEPAIAVAG